MTVSSTSRVAGPFAGTGSNATLPFAFKVLAATDLVVLRDGEALTLTTHYTVSLNADQNDDPGGTVTILAAANTTGAQVYVTSETQATQQTSIQSQSNFSPRVLETALDKLTIIAAELREKLSRAVVAPIGEDVSSLEELLAVIETTIAAAGAEQTEGIATAGENALAAIDEALAAVLVDENGYLYSTLTKTRYTYRIVGGVAELVVAPHIYLDPINGNDANAGTSPLAPIKTSAGLEAKAAFIAAVSGNTGITVAIKNGAEPMRDSLDYAENTNSFNGGIQLNYLSVVGYGDGPPRRITCLDIAPHASFTAHSTISDAWQISWSHELYADTSRFRVVVDGEPLVRVATQAETSAAGTYWYNGTPASGVAKTIVAHGWNDEDLSDAGVVVEITKRYHCVSARRGLFVQYVHGDFPGSNNGSFFCYYDPEWHALLATNGTKHNWVSGAGGHLYDVLAVNCIGASADYDPGGGTIIGTTYDPSPEGLAGKTAKHTRCAFIIDGSVYDNYLTNTGSSVVQSMFAHDTVGTGCLALWQFNDCWEIGLRAGATGQAQRIEFNGHYSTGHSANNAGTYQDGLYVAPGFTAATIYVRGGLFLGDDRTFEGGDIDIEGAVILTDGNAVNSFAATGVYWRLRNNMIGVSAPSSGAILTQTADGATLDIQGNLIHNSVEPVLTGTPASMTLNRNFYSIATSGAGLDRLVKLDGSYKNLAALRGLGYEDDGDASLSIADADLHADAFPSAPDFDVRRDTPGAYQDMLDEVLPLSRQPTQADIDAYLARPATLAEALEYIQLTAPRAAVVS